MRVSKIDKLMLSGITTRTNNENELNEETSKIPDLWNQYVEQNVDTKTFNKANNPSLYGIYSNYESDFNADYDYTIAVEVTKPKNAIVIENQRYLVFKKEGEVPEVVVDLWKEIWDYFEGTPKYERAYLVDFEQYSKENEIEIFISIK